MTVAAHTPDEARALLGMPPRQPGPGALPVRCGACENELGWIWKGWYFSRHQKRWHVAALPVRIRCEDCDQWTGKPEEA